MTKLVKEFLNEDHNLNVTDESSMAEKQIKTIVRYAEQLRALITPGMQLDAAIQSKLAVIENNIVEVTNYIESEADAPEILEPAIIDGPEDVTPPDGAEVELGGDAMGDEEMIDDIPDDAVDGEPIDAPIGGAEGEEVDLGGDELASEDDDETFDDEEMLMGMLNGDDDAEGGDEEVDTGGFKKKGDDDDKDDDDIVARQLREAEENESDPELKEKLWKEYEEYNKTTR